MIDIVLWLAAFSLLLWLFMSLLAGRPVNPVGVFLGVLLAPIAFLIGVAAVLFLVAPLLIFIAVPLALLAGFVLALFVPSALAGVGMLKALIALILAALLLALLGVALWRFPRPPSAPLRF